MKNFFIGAGSGIIFLLLIVSIYFFSGIFNIAVDAKHPFIDAILAKTCDSSAEFHSGKKLSITKNNSDIKKGTANFMETCVLCHGAPGYEKNNFANYINPIAPDFSEKGCIEDMSDASIFWTVKNGVRMTAMPSFGKLESDADIQNEVLFVKEMQNLKEADIKRLVK